MVLPVEQTMPFLYEPERWPQDPAFPSRHLGFLECTDGFHAQPGRWSGDSVAETAGVRIAPSTSFIAPLAPPGWPLYRTIR